MVPKDYKIAYEVLDAIWQAHHSESLAILLGSMRINSNDGLPMDRGALADWNQISEKIKSPSILDLVLAYIALEISRYKNPTSVPADIQQLFAALRTAGSPEREILDSVVAKWQRSMPDRG